MATTFLRPERGGYTPGEHIERYARVARLMPAVEWEAHFDLVRAIENLKRERNALVLAHNYHAVHHLWPTIPWHGYRAVFREKIAYLRQHDVPIEQRVFARRWQPGGAGALGGESLPR